MNLKKATLTIGAAGLLAGVATVPVVPEQMQWLGSYETIQFDTIDGDLSSDQYAIADEDHWYIRQKSKDNSQFTITNSEASLEGKHEVGIRCEKCAYYDEFTDGKQTHRYSSSKHEYDQLRQNPNAAFPTKTHNIPLVAALRPNKASAAIAFDAAISSGEKAAVSSYTFSHTVGAGSDLLLTVGISLFDTTDADRVINTLTYNGAALTQLRRDNSDTANVTSELRYKVGPSTGANTVSVTYAGTVTNSNAGAISFSGVDGSTPFEASNGVAAGACNGTTNCALTLTTISDNAWTVDVVGKDTTATNITAQTGQTERYHTEGGNQDYGGSTKGPLSPATTTQHRWNDASGFFPVWVLTIGALKPASASGGASTASPSDTVIFE